MDTPKQTIRPWPALEKKILGNHRIFTLTSTVRGKPGGDFRHTFLGLEAPDWVNVVAFTEDRKVVLVEQYRHGTDSITLEIPGGAVDPGEDPRTAGLRELEEETGFICDRCELLGCVEPNPAFLDNRCWTYLALGCRAEGTISLDPAEEIRIELISLSDFTAKINKGDICHALVVAAHDHLQRGLTGRAAWRQEVLGMKHTTPGVSSNR